MRLAFDFSLAETLSACRIKRLLNFYGKSKRPRLLIASAAFLCALMLTLSAGRAAHEAAWRVDEAASRIEFCHGETHIELMLENRSTERATTGLHVEIIAPDESVKASTGAQVRIEAGARQSIKLALPFDVTKLKPDERKGLAWYRLRYRLSDEAKADEEAKANSVSNLRARGVISFSNIAGQLFELYTIAPREVGSTGRQTVRVRAVQTATGAAVRGVEVAGELKFEKDDAGDENDGDEIDEDETEEEDVAANRLDKNNDDAIASDGVDKNNTENHEAKRDESADEFKVESRGVTDDEGVVTLAFDVPQKLNATDNEGELVIRGRVGDVEVEMTEDIEVAGGARVMLTTDKPLYQPGQTVRARALVLKKDGGALASARVTLKVTDQDDTLTFKETAQTSEYGIASYEWTTAGNLKLGTYLVQATVENYHESESSDFAAIKISRYETPNFYVTAQADNSFYLEAQTPRVEVAARYVFGQTVTRGRVRVVRETERRWDYKNQKYEIEEADEVKGVLDANGLFSARLKVDDEFKRLKDDDYQKYRDVNYTAYVTDDSTRRTEERRFTIRLSKQAIHVYTSEAGAEQVVGLPLEFFVTASFADGRAAANCRVEVRLEGDESETMLAQAVTNRFGVAKITGRVLRAEDFDNRQLKIKIAVRGKPHETGTETARFYRTNDTQLRIYTDKPLYAAGENIRGRVVSNFVPVSIMVRYTPPNTASQFIS